MQIVVCVAREGGDLVGVEGDELAGVANGGAVDELGAGRVALEAVDAHGVLEDAVRDGEVPDDGASGQAGGHDVVAQLLDVARGDADDGSIAPLGLEVPTDAEPVVAVGGELPSLDVLDVTQVGRGGVGEGCPARLVVVRALADQAPLMDQDRRKGILGLTTG